MWKLRMRKRVTNIRNAIGIWGLYAALAVPIVAQEPGTGTPEPTLPPAAPLSALQQRGAEIYRDQCADCHGAHGEGAEGAYEDPLIGDESIGQLAARIDKTMPEGSPEDCRGEDARAVAEYIYEAFYSEAAQIRNRPPRVMLTHLTTAQLRQSLADLYSLGATLPRETGNRGLSARYYNGDRRKEEELKLERVDPTIDFDWQRNSPVEGVDADSFSIEWNGGLMVPRSGRYEIIVRSTCSFLFYLGASDREFINNHVQSGNKTEFRRSIYLIDGRVYPLRIEFRQRKRKTEIPPARIQLAWVPPQGVEQTIPAEYLVPERPTDTLAIQTPLPPDDRSYGYERGIGVSREWEEATTAAAIEFAEVAIEELWPEYRRRHRGRDQPRAALRGFLQQLLEAAMRRPLTDELQERYIDKQLAAEPDDGEAIKRCLLAGLKSPYFLYPDVDLDQPKSARVANRLALILLDSLPADGRIRAAAQKNKLLTDDEVRQVASAYLDDHRLRSKTRGMLRGWLNLEHIADIRKDEELFPGFDQALVADLRMSLEQLLDEVVWQPESDYRQFFTLNQGITTRRIAEYYGEDWRPAGPWRRGYWTEPTVPSPKHLGLLTHPYLLSGLAYHDSTSPIHRGVFLIRYMLGRTIRPPADAFAPLSPDLHPDLTTRERVELQTSPEFCQSCHEKINALGFTLENYDAVGRFRELERGKPIDPRGRYVTRDGREIELQGAADVARFLAESDDAVYAFVKRAFQHFVKQPPAAFGADTMDRLVQHFRDSGYNIQELIVEIAVEATRPIRTAAEQIAFQGDPG
ncbi:MAG: DUF1588 domain-containing protein [Planctomycetota bacterium]|nr:MAG: DUF1588 domain-containing protein [Planctomycetota bacterium]